MNRRTVKGGADGPIWGVAEYGDPSGRVLLLHHGSIGSAVLPDFWDDYARAAGVRLIAVERPGYGLTPPLEMPSIAAWAALMEPVLDACGVTGFDVAGISAGAPYAYAQAAAPGSRVRGVWVLSGLPYVIDDGVRSHYPAEALAVWAFYRDTPRDELIAHFAEAAPGWAEAFAAHPTARTALAEMAGHGCLGPAREVELQTRPWGFTPGDVRRPVRLWHTPDDDMVPYDAVSATVALLPDAVLTRQPEPTHVPSDTTVRALFAELAAE
ncbi:alpha/beta hydrolase [Streptomyces sp. NPDC020875]|uniref:alpha/beta fold hydrolase n=1 Tax=Streptomyces sp. NPDC020875 TaxID=3154898 RepID=UPI0033C6892A